MNLTSETTQVFLKEFRCLGRDKHTLIASILVPLFLYPALVWGTLQILLYARGLEDRTESRVLVLGGTPGDDLWECLSELPRLRLVTPEEVWGPAGEVVARCLDEAGEAPPESDSPTKVI